MNEHSLSHLRGILWHEFEFTPAVCLQNVTVRQKGIEILSHIDFCLEEGNFLGVIGPNGGGKTILLHLILGLVPPTTGLIEIFGHHPCSRKARRIPIGFVPQYQTVPPGFPGTVYDMVLLGNDGARRNRDLSQKQLNDYALHILAHLKLEHVVDIPIARLSDGDLQRVWLARALISHPLFLLLDEPFRGIDASGKRRFLDLLVEMRKERDVSVIMVSQEIEILTRFSNRIACLNKTIHWHERSEWLSHDFHKQGYKCELKNRIELEKKLVEWNSNPFLSDSDPSVHQHL